MEQGFQVLLQVFGGLALFYMERTACAGQYSRERAGVCAACWRGAPQTRRQGC